MLENNTDKVTVLKYKNLDNLHTVCSMFIPLNQFAVVVAMPEQFAAEDLDRLAEYLENEYSLIAVLWHHPREPRIIRGQPAPTPGCPILIIQERDRLIAEKARLKDLGYYQAWK